MRERINAALTDVLASDIEEGLKTYVARALRKILTAIDEYKLGARSRSWSQSSKLLGTRWSIRATSHS